MVFKVNACSMQSSYCVVRMNMQIEIIATAAELQTPTANRLPTLIDGFIFSAVVKIRTNSDTQYAAYSHEVALYRKVTRFPSHLFGDDGVEK